MPRAASDTTPIPAPIDHAGPAWQHIRAIDGLRGLAVVGVIAFHDGRLSGGFLGVDLFFALSGFLITGLLMKEYGSNGSISLRGFWERRFRRLLPAVLVMLALLPLIYRLWGTAQQRVALHADTPWALIYAANWHQIISSSDYWALFNDPSPLTHLWSLAIEEQFYLIWPLAFWALMKLRRRWMMIAIVAAGLVASATAMAVLFDPNSPTRVYIGTDTRAFSILAGVLICLLGASGGIATAFARWSRTVNVVAVALIGLVVFSWFIADEHSSGLFRGGLLLHSLAAAAICAAVFGSPSLWIARALSWRPLVMLGTISYGLYLWHWPVFALLTPTRSGLDPWLVSLLRYAISLTLAIVSFFAVERPIRSRKVRIAGRRGVVVALGAAAGVLGVVIVVPRPTARSTALNSSSFLAPPQSAATSTAADHTVPGAAATTTDRTTLNTTIARATGQTAATAPVDAASSPAASDSAASKPPVAQPSSQETAVDHSATGDATSTSTTSVDNSTISADAGTAVVGSSARQTAIVAKSAITSVLWEGDSVAYDEAPGVVAALTAAGLQARENTVLGFGVVPHNNIDIIKRFTDSALEMKPSVVVYQLSNWDSQFAPELQRSSFDSYVSKIRSTGAALVLLAPPPVDLTRQTEDHSVLSAEATRLSNEDPLNIIIIDSSTLWGPTYQRDLDGDGIPDRKADGVHICPEGAARIGNWLVDQLNDRFTGVAPASPASWVTGPWSTDPRYNNPNGTCNP